MKIKTTKIFEAIVFIRKYRGSFHDCARRAGVAHTYCDGGAVWVEQRFEEEIAQMRNDDRTFARSAALHEGWEYGADMLRAPNIR